MTHLSVDLFDDSLDILNPEQQDLRKKLSDHVWMLAGDIGARSLTQAPDGLKKAAEYIEYVFRKFGYPTQKQEFEADVFGSDLEKPGSKTVHKTHNIIAELPGSDRASEIIIVGAHYDTEYASPGANDNASGIAVLLELSRILRERKQHRCIRFVAFTNEEQPYCRTEQMGSWQYARLCMERKEKILAMLCLETIGYYSDEAQSQRLPDPSFEIINHDRGNFIAFISNLKSRGLLDQFTEAFRSSIRFPSIAVATAESVRGVDYSDHQNFWQLGIPALMITDTAFYRYPHYHESTDTPEKLDFDKLARITAAIADSIQELSKS